MAVTFDAANSAVGNSTTASVSITCAANSLVIVGVHFEGTPTASNPTFDGNAMTLIQRVDDVYLYRYTGHASGSRTASVTRSTSGDWVIGVVSVTGFDTDSPVGTFQIGQSTETTAVTSAAITTGSTEWLIVDAALMITDASAASAGQTERVSRDSYNGGFRSFGMSTKVGAASTTTLEWTASSTFGDNALIAIPIRPSAGGSSVTKTPTTGNLSLGGLLVTHDAFTHVRIRDVLINESGQPIANAANITLKVWYSGYCSGPANFSINGQTTDANGTTSWSITRGSLTSGSPIFYVAQDSLSFSNYTCARMIPSYE